MKQLFNLQEKDCYKNNQFFSDGDSMTKSLHRWIVKGNVKKFRECEHGFWLTITGEAKIPNVFTYNKSKFDCWVSKSTIERTTNKFNFLSSFKAVGSFVFKEDETYFVIEELL